MKSRDGKGSDRGEGNSPAFHEHGDHRNPFNDGSEDLEERPSATQPCASDVETLEEVPNDTSKELCYENGNGGDTSK